MSLLPNGFVLPGDKTDDSYQIVGKLGQGGFGITYLAVSTNNDQIKYAIKEYFPLMCASRGADYSVNVKDHSANDIFVSHRDKFLEEAQILFFLDNPNIVKAVDCFKMNNTVYMVMKYIKGKALSFYLKTKWTEEKVIEDLLLPLLNGLQVLHANGIIHRDIKPDNILIRDDNYQPMLLDFGAARFSDQSDFTRIVSPGYSPYEQHLGEGNGPWTDIYAVGALVFRALTGEKPPTSDVRTDAKYKNKKDPMADAYHLLSDCCSKPFLDVLTDALMVFHEDRLQSVDHWLKKLEQTSSFSIEQPDVKEQAPKRQKQRNSSIPNNDDLEILSIPDVVIVTSDKSWTKALLLSLFLGPFGVDRFYLGYTKLGTLKLLSFGGVFLWALIDLILLLFNKIPDADGDTLRPGSGGLVFLLLLLLFVITFIGVIVFV